MASLNDISHMELLSSAISSHQFAARLRSSLARTLHFRGAVAYWTVEPHYVSDAFPAVLGSPGSFVCIDHQLPTSIHQLAHLAVASGSTLATPHIYLHVRSFQGQPETPGGGRDMPHHLLHPKMLLLDFDNGMAELWVGSHNWTVRALSGMNIETTLVVSLKQDSILYRDAARELEAIRDLCEPFNPDAIYYDLALQGIDAQSLVFECVTTHANQMKDQQIDIFGTDEVTLNQGFGVQVNADVYILAFDKTTKVLSRYRSHVITMSRSRDDIRNLARIPRGRTRHGWVYRQDKTLAMLQHLNASRPEELVQSAFCVSLHIDEALPEDVRILELNRQEQWMNVSGSEQNADPFWRRMTREIEDTPLYDDPQYANHLMHLRKKVTLRKPITLEEAQAEYKPKLEQLLMNEHPLVFIRKYVISPTSNGDIKTGEVYETAS